MGKRLICIGLLTAAVAFAANAAAGDRVPLKGEGRVLGRSRWRLGKRRRDLRPRFRHRDAHGQLHDGGERDGRLRGDDGHEREGALSCGQRRYRVRGTYSGTICQGSSAISYPGRSWAAPAVSPARAPERSSSTRSTFDPATFTGSDVISGTILDRRLELIWRRPCQGSRPQRPVADRGGLLFGWASGSATRARLKPGARRNPALASSESCSALVDE